MNCFDCPLNCGADRQAGETGACGAGKYALITRAARHYFEEPPISGTRGSGAVFFAGCNLRCVFCQNYGISRPAADTPGRLADEEGLASVMLSLQKAGAHNINLVTPAPHLRLIAGAIPLARERGLTLPIVYNTNGYEKPESLRLLDGLIDVYLPDYKYVTPALAQRFSGAADYPEYALASITEMFRQVGKLKTDDDGIAVRGLIIRHLVLPCAVDETRRVLESVAEHFPKTVHLSLMSQYTPIPGMKKPLDRRLTRGEYRRALDKCIALGFENVFIQRLSSADAGYTPEFNGFFE